MDGGRPRAPTFAVFSPETKPLPGPTQKDFDAGNAEVDNGEGAVRNGAGKPQRGVIQKPWVAKLPRVPIGKCASNPDGVASQTCLNLGSLHPQG